MTFFCRHENVLVEEIARDLQLVLKPYRGGFCLYTKRGSRFIDAICSNHIELITIPDDNKFSEIRERARSLPYLVEYRNLAPHTKPRIH